MDRVLIKGLELFGRLGVFADEKEKGQRFIVDIEVGLCLRRAGQEDELSQTIDYGELALLAQKMMEEARFDLLESYAEALAAGIFSKWPRSQRVTIRVSKPDAPIKLEFLSMGIELRRTRDG